MPDETQGITSWKQDDDWDRDLPLEAQLPFLTLGELEEERRRQVERTVEEMHRRVDWMALYALAKSAVDTNEWRHPGTREEWEAVAASATSSTSPRSPDDPPTVDGGDASFWNATPVLRHVHAFALSRRVSPWALLGEVLARVVAATPPSLKLPPLVGTYASLNLFVASVGRPGEGKGAAQGAARDCLVGLPAPESEVNVGSGEGIAHMFARRRKDGVVERVATRVLFSAPEVDTLTALDRRQGSTLMGQLRSGWSGEPLGFAYATASKRLPIDQHSYRLCLVVGVQPLAAEPLLDQAVRGTPQRFVWLPVTNPEAPDVAPPSRPPLTWRPSPSLLNTYVMDVCAEARREIDAAHLARHRGEVDALDGHAALCRLKVAAALALLHGDVAVAYAYWRLAGDVMRVSDATRANVVRQLAEAHRDENAQRGRAEGYREIARSEVVESAAVLRVAERMIKLLCDREGWMTHSELRTAIAYRDRDLFYAALASLGDRIEQAEGAKGGRYRCAT